MRIENTHREEDAFIATIRGFVIGWMCTRKRADEMRAELLEFLEGRNERQQGNVERDPAHSGETD